MKQEIQKSVTIRNRKASHEFHFLEQIEAGIVLKGSEIKSIRMGKASLQESYCDFIDGELFVLNMHINPYEQASFNAPEPRRPRKLLLHKKELRKWRKKKEEKGKTIVPTQLYINEKGKAKLVVALAQGKKLFDKRQTEKERQVKREMDRAMK